MKKIFNKILIALTVVLLFAACKKDAVLTYLDVVTFPPSITASTKSVALNTNNNDSSVVSFSWPFVPFKIKAAITYKLQIDVPADTIGITAWKNAYTIEVGDDVLGKSLLGKDLNSIALTKLGLVSDSTSTIVVRAVAVLDRSVFSNAVAVTVKPFKVVVKNVLYVPGQYQGWSPETAPKLSEATGHPKMYEGYYNMAGSGTMYFKFTSAPDWIHINYGDGGNGTFSTDGAAGGLSVPNGGYYQLTADLNTNKWTATKTIWGIIGGATPGGWGGSTPMTYDPVGQVWKITANMLANGSFKFRANDEWKIDFAVDSNGKLLYADHPFFGYTAGLNDLTVPTDGNYTITLDLHVSGVYNYDLHKN